MKRFVASIAATLSLVSLIGCASSRQPNTHLSHFGLNTQPTIEYFEVCDSAGCRSTSKQSYTPDEWRSIAAIFDPTPEDAAAERERVNLAVGAMESIIGAKNGTLGDAQKNQRELGTGKQLDCIAEATNTTVALILLKQNGLIQYHDVAYPKHRGFLNLRYPHNAASLIEHSTGDIYVIDSWFFAGGEPAVSVPLEKWKTGYSPHDDPDFVMPGENN